MNYLAVKVIVCVSTLQLCDFIFLVFSLVSLQLKKSCICRCPWPWASPGHIYLMTNCCDPVTAQWCICSWTHLFSAPACEQSGSDINIWFLSHFKSISISSLTVMTHLGRHHSFQTHTLPLVCFQSPYLLPRSSHSLHNSYTCSSGSHRSAWARTLTINK